MSKQSVIWEAEGEADLADAGVIAPMFGRAVSVVRLWALPFGQYGRFAPWVAAAPGHHH
jgi:hypothetical protein